MVDELSYHTRRRRGSGNLDAYFRHFRDVKLQGGEFRFFELPAKLIKLLSHPVIFTAK